MANTGEFQMPQISEKDRRRAIRWGIIVIGIVILVTVILSILSPYVDYLWYLHDARQPQVFTLSYETKALLFAPAFLLSWALLHFSLKRAFRLSLIYLENPSTTGQVFISNALHFVQERGWTLVRIVAPIFAFFSAMGFSSEWNVFLLFRHTQDFGMRDPIFGLDLGFFVFVLPWYRVVVSYVFGVVLLATILTIAIYAGLQLLAAMAKVELGRPNVRMHICLLVGASILVLGVQNYLKTYEFGLSSGSQFVGAGFAATFEMHAQQVVAVLFLAIGLLTLALSRHPSVYAVLLRAA